MNHKSIKQLERLWRQRERSDSLLNKIKLRKIKQAVSCGKPQTKIYPS